MKRMKLKSFSLTRNSLIKNISKFALIEGLSDIISELPPKIEFDDFQKLVNSLDKMINSASRIRLIPYFCYNFKPSSIIDEKTCIELVIEDVFDYQVFL